MALGDEQCEAVEGADPTGKVFLIVTDEEEVCRDEFAIEWAKDCLINHLKGFCTLTISRAEEQFARFDEDMSSMISTPKTSATASCRLRQRVRLIFRLSRLGTVLALGTILHLLTLAISCWTETLMIRCRHVKTRQTTKPPLSSPRKVLSTCTPIALQQLTFAYTLQTSSEMADLSTPLPTKRGLSAAQPTSSQKRQMLQQDANKLRAEYHGKMAEYQGKLAEINKLNEAKAEKIKVLQDELDKTNNTGNATKKSHDETKQSSRRSRVT